MGWTLRGERRNGRRVGKRSAQESKDRPGIENGYARVRLAYQVVLVWQNAFRMSLGRCEGRDEWAVARCTALGAEMKVTSVTTATRPQRDCERIDASNVPVWRQD